MSEQQLRELIGLAASALTYYVEQAPGFHQTEEFERRFGDLLDRLVQEQAKTDAVERQWTWVNAAPRPQKLHPRVPDPGRIKLTKAELVDALALFGQHEEDCNIQWDDPGQCSCGWERVYRRLLAAYGGDLPDVPGRGVHG